MTLTSMDAIKSEMIEIICSNLIMPSWHRVNRESAHLLIQRIDRAVNIYSLEYHSGAKKTYSDEFTIDLKAGVSMPYGKVATEGKELRTISYALQEMLQKNL